jgi:hypothetical protein
MIFDTNELRNYVFLRNLLDAFQQQALKYCSSAATEGERFDRIKEIRDVITGDKLLPIGAIATYPNCGDLCCEGTACVPCNARSGWPQLEDPQRWDA